MKEAPVKPRDYETPEFRVRPKNSVSHSIQPTGLFKCDRALVASKGGDVYLMSMKVNGEEQLATAPMPVEFINGVLLRFTPTTEKITFRFRNRSAEGATVKFWLRGAEVEN